jgi:hypothetical protein
MHTGCPGDLLSQKRGYIYGRLFVSPDADRIWWIAYAHIEIGHAPYRQI